MDSVLVFCLFLPSVFQLLCVGGGSGIGKETGRERDITGHISRIWRVLYSLIYKFIFPREPHTSIIRVRVFPGAIIIL